MKKMFLLTLVLMLIPILTFSQIQDPSDPDPGGGIGDYFLTFGALVTLIPLVVDVLNQAFKMSGLVLQVVSWVMGLVLGLIAYFLGLGMFSELSLLNTLLISVGASLAANGLADTGIIRSILNLIPGINLKSFKKS